MGIPVGYDLNNPCNCNFRNKGAGWEPFSEFDLEGAMMIRPVFGGVVNTFNSTSDEEMALRRLNVFPNPATNLLNVEIEDRKGLKFQYSIINQFGQVVDQGQLTDAINIQTLTNGHYFLQVMDETSGETWVEKFVVLK